MKRLSGETVLITGATGMIGTSIAKKFHEEGARVIICSRTMDKAEQWTEQYGKGNKTLFLPVACDLREENQILAMFDHLKKQDFFPSVLVANASCRDDLATPFKTLGEKNFTKLFEVDVAGHFLCARTLIERSAASTKPSIVFLSSIYAEAGVDSRIYSSDMIPTPVTYSATKAGVLGMTRYLAGTWGERGIRVNAIVAGGVRSEKRQPQDFVDKFSKKTMLGRMASPEEIASAVLFLASQEASYITGHCLNVDGGMLAW